MNGLGVGSVAGLHRSGSTARSAVPRVAGAIRSGRGWDGAALACAALLAGASACGDARADGAEGDAGAEPFARVVNVEVTELAPRSFEETVQLTGVVHAYRDVRVAAEESGVIREILADKGTSVPAGAPIARIDDGVLRAQVDEARARADLARQTWERRRRLWEEDGIGTEMAYLEARYAAEQAAASLRALDERLARTTIRAPFEGVVDDRYVEVGSMVSPGQEVARIVDLDPVKIAAGVPERYASDVRPGGEASVTFDVLPGARHNARIGFVGSTVNPRNRTFSIEFELPNPAGTVKPEMVANVSVRRRRLGRALVVPQDALVRVADGFVAFVVEGEGEAARARVRRVRIGPAQRNDVVVEVGLSEGDLLVVVGQRSVADGDRVRVVAGRDAEGPGV